MSDDETWIILATFGTLSVLASASNHDDLTILYVPYIEMYIHRSDILLIE